MFALSVIVCSHNSREDYLRRALAALRAQTLAVTEWELLLVDNASSRAPAGRSELSWHPHGRYVREEKMGLAHARLRGIAESQGDLLVLVDDDNVLRADYLQACLSISGEHPWLGAWNGSCIPEYEAKPPAEIRPFLWALSTEKLNASVWARLPQNGPALPTGAGMAVRRCVAEQYRELALHDPLRQALSLNRERLGAVDLSDIALTTFKLGLGAGRFPELELTRLISARSVTLDYLEPLFEGIGYGGVILGAIHGTDRPNPGQSGSGALKLFLLRITMLAALKSRTERRIKLAEERGRLAARRDLHNLDLTR